MGGLRVTDDGHIVLVFDVKQGSGRFVWQAFGHFFIHKMHHLRLDGRRTHAGRRLLCLLLGQHMKGLVGPALGLHGNSGELMAKVDRLRIDRGHQPRLKRRSRAKTLLTHFAQQITHGHGDVTKINFDGTRAGAFVANRAVVSHVLKFLPMLDGHTTARLLFVKKSLYQQRGRQNFVTRAVEQICTWYMGGTHRFAFATA